MIRKEILKNQKKIEDLELIERDFDFDELDAVFKVNKIIALIWPRRAGKTFLTYQIIKHLIKQWKISIKQVCYIDFSALLNKNISIEEIKENYFTLFPDKKPIFIFDEIQELNEFPSQLISLLNEQYKVIITGSNAHLLSRELSTILRGKVYTKEILPLTFKEYLYFKNIPTDKHSKIADFAKYKGYFVDFLTWWWFPEIVLNDNNLAKENILKSYMDIMIYKDLQDRYNIKNDFALNFFIKRVLSTYSKELNINKIYNDLKSQNIEIGRETLYNFSQYLSDIYLISNLKNYWAKIKWTPKTYLLDVGYANVMGNMDLWRRFENFIYLELKKKYREVYFLNQNYEIDFYLPEKETFIQVVYNLNIENLERETKHFKEQQGEKKLIYFEKDDDLIVDKSISLVWFEKILEE